MKMLFASDSFKGSLTAVEICDLLQEAAADIFPDAETVSLPVADGGEGTVDALLCAMGGRRMTTRVTGPLLMPVDAQWGLLGDGQTAVLEMAQASGLPYVPAAQRDPRKTTSFGTGELIAEAVRCGAKSLLIGIGGSATNDGGLGMLSALGAVFTDRQGKPVPPTGGALADVCHADFSGLMPELADCRITVLCDVTNPLLGATGATYTYGPQKGATPEICAELEAGMKHYAQVVENTIGRGIADFPGAGAAGGLGAALGGVLKATLKSGIDAVLETVRFDEQLKQVNLVVTGEGRIDGQSVQFGKVPIGVARRCAKANVPVLCICGGIGAGAEGLFDVCESTIQTTVSKPMALSEAIENARTLYLDAAKRLFRAVRIGQKLHV